MKEGIPEIVERARNGDQVAQALLIEANKAAKKGSRKAKAAVKEINRYIRKNPARIGAERPPNVSTNPHAQEALWSARESKPEQFAAMVVRTAPHLSPWALACAIFHGPKITPETPLFQIVDVPKSKIAQCVSVAFKLQRLENTGIPISSYCPRTACELGE